MTIYALKTRFQSLLRPLVGRLARAGVTANQVTVLAALGSIALGVYLSFANAPRELFLLVPVWFIIRMALNAVDGMLAREHGQASRLGAYLNEIGDVLSDAALYLPFAFVAPFTFGWIGTVIFLAALSELAGVLGTAVGAGRRYDGPMGKSDRAAVFGALGLWVGLSARLPAWSFWVMPVMALLVMWTIVNRIRAGLRGPGRDEPSVEKFNSPDAR